MHKAQQRMRNASVTSGTALAMATPRPTLATMARSLPPSPMPITCPQAGHIQHAEHARGFQPGQENARAACWLCT
jgi:hypothetical protein